MATSERNEAARPNATLAPLGVLIGTPRASGRCATSTSAASRDGGAWTPLIALDLEVIAPGVATFAPISALLLPSLGRAAPPRAVGRQ